MIPKKIIFFTRDTQTPLHCGMAKQFRELYPEAKILFVSFFSISCQYAQEEGFESVYVPDELRKVGDRKFPEEKLLQLDTFCRKEGMGVNAMLNTERFLDKDPVLIDRFFHQHLLVLDSLIEEQTLGVSTLYDHFVYLAAGMITHWKEGKWFAFVGCGVPGHRMLAVRLPWETWKNPNYVEDEKTSLEHCRSEVLLPSEQRISYMSARKTYDGLSLKDRWRLAKMRKLAAQRDYDSGSYFPTHQRNRLKHSIRWRWRKFTQRVDSAIWNIKSEQELEKIGGKKVFLALHMEPEATILMYSHRLRDQIEACRLVSEALPVGYTLLVKENPKMQGKRPLGYYAALKSFRNVRLVALSVPSASLIERSEAVVSLAGTVTVEARLRGKPAYCFGRPPFWKLASAIGTDNVLEALSKLDDSRPARGVPPLSEAEWQEWASATFVGTAGLDVFNHRIGRMSYDGSNDNARCFTDFIHACLQP